MANSPLNKMHRHILSYVPQGVLVRVRSHSHNQSHVFRRQQSVDLRHGCLEVRKFT
jgi:hypothetical protein